MSNSNEFKFGLSHLDYLITSDKLNEQHRFLLSETTVGDDTDPWYLTFAVMAIVTLAVGNYWDVSFHMSIGRDHFLTPAHVALYLGGLFGALPGVFLIFWLTLGLPQSSENKFVHIWGFRGPLGAFISAWGGAAMLVSAPFDNWWHNAYGLDTVMVNPPHSILFAGMAAVNIGAIASLLKAFHRKYADSSRFRIALDSLIGFSLVEAWVMVLIYSQPRMMHSSTFYEAAFLFSGILTAISVGSDSYWAATTASLSYIGSLLLAVWLLPLWPAQPKLGPVYHVVTHFVPLGFPLLLVGPAIAIDLTKRFFPKSKIWLFSIVSGAVFITALVLVQWPFAEVLLSPIARNKVFGMSYFAFSEVAGALYDAYKFQFPEGTTSAFWSGMCLATLYSMIASVVGYGLGTWMRELKR